MGVTGLWTVLQPCARPIKLETLNKKRLAVDASIWIYQFLKAVRDKEGNALRNSHVVGFFRRICKLLFFGIKPVFVFDGGAPVLKRQTISGRKARREGRREDAVRTAGKLLAVQMMRRAEEEERKRKEEKSRPVLDENEEAIPENLVYVDELQMTEKERQQNRKFKKKDAYHLPDLDVSLSEMGAPNDPRIMSTEELEEYARQFHRGEDVSIYDFSKIDFNGPFFQSLPASDRYNILNAARLRSRLRMGYSKEQLDTMFPDRMAFSKFQIERVRERNELTQRLMNLNGMNGEDVFGIGGTGRVAGEKGKEYVLVKNDGVEGGWALGVVSNKNDGDRNKPIDVERLGAGQEVEDDSDEEWEDDGFEDVPIEGLNRLPKRASSFGGSNNNTSTENTQRRQDLYRQRQQELTAADLEGSFSEDDPDSLFVGGPRRDVDVEDETDELFDDVPVPMSDDDEEELQRAIAMSLEDPEQEVARDDREVSFAGMISRPSVEAGRAFAHIANARANALAPRSLANHDEREKPDLQESLAKSRQTKYRPKNSAHVHNSQTPPKSPNLMKLTPRQEPSISTLAAPGNEAAQTSGFDGPLPFESVKWVKKIFTKKKQKIDPEDEGGFEKDTENAVPKGKEKSKAPPLPPWFSGDLAQSTAAQKEFENTLYRTNDPKDGLHAETPVLNRLGTGKVIDLEEPVTQDNKPIEIHSSSEDDDVLMEDVLPASKPAQDPLLTPNDMNDVADLIRIEPPAFATPQNLAHSAAKIPAVGQTEVVNPTDQVEDEEESIEWEESDREVDNVNLDRTSDTEAQIELNRPDLSKSPSPDFEDVEILGPLKSSSPLKPPLPDNAQDNSTPQEDYTSEGLAPIDDNDEYMYSDPDDEDLMRQLAVEAEEHARFASTLNSQSHLQNAEDYERELRQLRNQQKKDRRDADEVSHIMVIECQQLLKLFGIPYITAPMEAEAQCAELVNLGLVDGIVTDDSDIFLFGGTRVYKNLFNQAKFVECYLASDLEKEYSLTRTKIIQIAHLLGSDYTEGIPSVGPVTALEILSEFDNLEAFRDWWELVQTGRKPDDDGSAFRRKFKRNAAKIFLPAGFPNPRVNEAYLHPEVDSDPSPFAWGVPDLDSLRQFLMATIGWTQERVDEILVPVVRDMNRRENEGTQANITRFFDGAVGAGSRDKGGNASFAPRRREGGKSRRMETALGRLHDQAQNRTVGEGEKAGPADGNEAAVTDGRNEAVGSQKEATSKEPKKRKAPKRAVPAGRAESGSGSESDDDGSYEAPRKVTKRNRAGAK